MNEPLHFERAKGVAWLTLNRPTVGNAIDVSLSRALLEAAVRCDEDQAVRCVVLRGSGRLFCAGGDISAFSAAGESIAELLKELATNVHAAVLRFARMNKPLVTAINGPAGGAGVSLAILGDIALAARTAHFTLAYPAIGLSPDGGATWLLPRLIGLRRAQEMALLNKRYSAEEAGAVGLVTRVVDDEALASETEAVAEKLVSSATQALGRARSLLLTSYTSTLEAQLEAEARSIIEAGQSSEAREGIAAFLQKRKPSFNA
jgi:2-(1,2-epoxy-1,2-dihydrophenyl)acetyl-CoA isomerase